MAYISFVHYFVFGVGLAKLASANFQALVRVQSTVITMPRRPRSGDSPPHLMVVAVDVPGHGSLQLVMDAGIQTRFTQRYMHTVSRDPKVDFLEATWIPAMSGVAGNRPQGL